MSDRFKFRGYWYNDTQKEWWVYDKPEFITGDGTAEIWSDSEGGAYPELPNDAELHLCQCTGLKDKSGKLIYEGDIVEFYSQSLLDAMSRKGLARRVGQVVWNDEFLKFDVIVKGKAVPDLCKETDDNNFEVIGNIYENKDLLNA